MGQQKETVIKQEVMKSVKDTVLNKLLKASTKAVIKLSTIINCNYYLHGIGFYVDNKVGVETDIESFMPQEINYKAFTLVRDTVGSTDGWQFI